MQLGPAITSKANERVKALRASLSGKASRPGELVGIEGEHLVAEAMRSGLVLETVFVRQGTERLLDKLDVRAKQAVLLSAEVFDSAMDTRSPQGIAATLAIPAPEEKPASVVLVLEDVQDPGNLGTLIRSAEAFRVPLVYVTTGSANAWSPKVMRSSTGSVFRVPVVRATLDEIAARVAGRNVVAAVAQAAGTVVPSASHFVDDVAIMIGNEGAGLSAKALAIATERVSIPCAVESLNAAIAGSVLMYESDAQRRKAGR